jgi:PHP family Zn ribbon phosphoesterase
MDRIQALSDREEPFVPDYRPPYHFQIPLEFIPGLGRKKIEGLLARFGTEMNILHTATLEELAAVIGLETANYIVQAREDKLVLEVGGGGHYGKVKRQD